MEFVATVELRDTLAPAVAASLLLDALRGGDQAAVHDTARATREHLVPFSSLAQEEIDLFDAVAEDVCRRGVSTVHVDLLWHLAAPLLRSIVIRP
jgi:hypothetical protein